MGSSLIPLRAVSAAAKVQFFAQRDLPLVRSMTSVFQPSALWLEVVRKSFRCFRIDVILSSVGNVVVEWPMLRNTFAPFSHRLCVATFQRGTCSFFFF